MAGDDVLEEFYVRIRKEEVKEDFERINKELDERTGNYGNMNTAIFAIKLAAKFLRKKDRINKKIENCLP